MQGEVQEALRESTWKDWENKNKEGYVLVRKMEELDEIINSLNIDNGSVNPATQAIMMGLQAKGIQSQIRVNQATVAEKIANAAKTNAEKKNIEEERPNIEAQGRSIEAGINLLNQQKLTENERTKLTRLQGEVQEALRESTWKDWENKNKEGYVLVRKMGELDATINGMNIS